MGMNKDILLLRDVVEIAKYLAWQNDKGDKIAQEIMNDIHNGKYGNQEGVWVQSEKAILNFLDYESGEGLPPCTCEHPDSIYSICHCGKVIV